MEENKARQEDNQETIKMNIQQFIEATRQYLFETTAVPAAVSVAASRQVA